MRGKELEAAPAGRAAAAAARGGAEPAAPLCGGACPDEAVEGPSGGTPSEAPHGPGDDSRWPLHRFPQPVDPATLPARFTCPFCYTPHPLCIAAASCVQEYLATCRAWSDELAAGKMFGVLVVRHPEGGVGFLAAFSGNLAGSNRHSYFVPPVYDMLRPGDFFRQEEAAISALNGRVARLERDPQLCEACAELERLTRQAACALDEARTAALRAKAERDRQRAERPDEALLAALVRQSQHEKAELRRLRQRWNERLAAARARVGALTEEVVRLKDERHRRSAELQHRLFARFRMLNARGEVRDLNELFADTPQRVPPAGAGECAAPKLLQYAYVSGLHPVAMAEFWWGASPRGEVRRHGCYYPACRGKCGPILRHMLQGLNVDPNPLERPAAACGEPRVLWEDASLAVVCKPAGMLSVPGLGGGTSLLAWLRDRYPHATGPLLVHRLDMATSGLLLCAKTLDAYRRLQAQFCNRTVRKRYVALLDGAVAADEGVVELPMRADWEDRPRQRVCFEHGAPARTEYRVLSREGGVTRVALHPVTGRTHQLRVHASHPSGLDAPIVGDTLYGRGGNRLFLHAELLTFRHPFTGEELHFEFPADF